MTRHQLCNLSDEELVALATAAGVTLPIPYSQLESEEIARGVTIDAVARSYLIQRLMEVAVA